MMPRRDERGAVFPLTVVIMALIVAVLSLVIDVGHDRVVRRDMQAMADVIALDMARVLDGRPAGAYTATELDTARDASVARQRGLVEPDVEVHLAVADRMTGDWHMAAATEVPNAVQVESNGTFAFRISPRTPTNTVQAAALAVIGPPIACISVGATFADVNLNQQGALDTLLGQIVGVDRLSVLDPYALAALDLEIPLADLAAELEVGSVSEIMTTRVSAEDFLLAISAVLPPPNNNNPSPKSLLDAIIGGNLPEGEFTIGDILHVDTSGGSGGAINVNTFTLVQAVIMAAEVQNQIANGEHFVDISKATDVDLGVLKTSPTPTLGLRIVDPPRIVCGSKGSTEKAESAQVQLRLTGGLKALNGLVASATIDELILNVAKGTGTITDVQCTSATPTVSVSATAAAAEVGVRVTAKTLTLITLKISAPESGTAPIETNSPDSATHTFEFPPDDNPDGMDFGGGFDNLGLANLDPHVSPDLVGLLSPLLGSVVMPLLGNLIDPLASNLLSPILTDLGLSIGKVRIQPTGRPSCNEPFLLE